MEESDVQQIAINLLTPQVTRLLTMCAASLATVGVTVNVGQGSAGQIASALVGLAIIIWHEFSAIRAAKANARSAYVQGAAAAGSTILPSEVPKVVNAPAPVPIIPPQPSLKPTVDASGNVSITPANPLDYK